MIKLTKKQRDMLWGIDGPYSEVDLKIQTRILNDEITRKFVEVEVNINPTTFEICKQNMDYFKDDIMTYQLLNHGLYVSPEFGYKSCTFRQEYRDEKVIREAMKSVKYTEETLIKMHKFILEFLK